MTFLWFWSSTSGMLCHLKHCVHCTTSNRSRHEG